MHTAVPAFRGNSVHARTCVAARGYAGGAIAPSKLPFLRGAAAYPHPDPGVGGFYGWLAQFVSMPAYEPLSDLHELPPDLAQIGLDG